MKEFAVRMLHEDGQKTAEVHLYNAIGGNFAGGVSASAFVDSIKGIPPDTHIEMHYNTAGGSPFEAVAMATALAAHPGGHTAIVDGLCASSATIPFSVASVRKMRKGSMLMIHEPWEVPTETPMRAADFSRKAVKLKAVTESAIGFYAEATGKSPESLAKMMADETWLSPEAAQQEGFATEEIAADAVAAHFELGDFSNVPDAAMLLVSQQTEILKGNTMPTAEPAVAGTVTMTDVQFSEFMDKFKTGKAEDPKDPVEPVVEMSAVDAVEAFKNRSADIRTRCALAEIPEEKIQMFIDSDMSDTAITEIVEAYMVANNSPASGTGGEGGEDPDKDYKQQFQDAVADGTNMSCTELEYVNVCRVEAGKSELPYEDKKE